MEDFNGRGEKSNGHDEMSTGCVEKSNGRRAAFNGRDEMSTGRVEKSNRRGETFNGRGEKSNGCVKHFNGCMEKSNGRDEHHLASVEVRKASIKDCNTPDEELNRDFGPRSPKTERPRRTVQAGEPVVAFVSLLLMAVVVSRLAYRNRPTPEALTKPQRAPYRDGPSVLPGMLTPSRVLRMGARRAWAMAAILASVVHPLWDFMNPYSDQPEPNWFSLCLFWIGLLSAALVCLSSPPSIRASASHRWARGDGR